MGALFSGTVGPVPAVVLLAVAVTCAVTDLWKGKIYNAVTYPAMAIGVVLAVVQHGAPGIFYALGGFAVGFFPAFVVFALGGMGGGDVKLLGAIGAWSGWLGAVWVLVLGSALGGVLAVVALLRLGARDRAEVAGNMMRFAASGGLVVPEPSSLSRSARARGVPFGVALAVAGALVTGMGLGR
jgi:prepilin peptidase CpaA